MPELLPFYKEDVREAGCDEAGRGCLAGPVVAAAVILPPDFICPELTDSKQLNEKQRLALKSLIENKALAYSVAFVNHTEIDKLNILQASIKAMHLALDGLSVKPEYIIVDGNRFKKYGNIPHTCMVKGDARFLSIAAASVLAKTARDAYMCVLHEKFPEYNWQNNKGYPTQAHREAIRIHGVSTFHRKTFRLLPEEQLRLLF